MNYILIEQIEELISRMRGEDITQSQQVIDYVESFFPAKFYEHEKRMSSDDFFVENKLIIYLSYDNESKIVISFPEGDRFGNYLSDPDTDISIELFKNNQIIQYPLFQCNHTKERWYDEILQIKEDISRNSVLDTEYVLSSINESLDMYPPVLPYHLLKRMNNELLQDVSVKSAVINGMTIIAKERTNRAIYQYEHGRFGGEDVADWKLQEKEQFRAIELPENVKSIYSDIIEDVYLNYESQLSDTTPSKQDEIYEEEREL